MAIRIFLTSDLHLGMKFAGYPEVQAELSEARFKALERLVMFANQNTCNLFVIAGDLFDRVTVSKRDVIRAALLLKDFHGSLVAVLPGNHDFISPGQTDLWATFKESAGDRVLILEEKRIYPLAHYDLDGTLYAAPCTSKHSSENAIGWIRDARADARADARKGSSVKNHIGVAHGSLEGFSPDFDQRYYPMTPQELMATGMDLWLLGHTHTQYPSLPGQTDRIFYPGTPEPDGFDCQHEGKAWILDLSGDRSVTPLSIQTGHHRFLHEEVQIRNSGDLETLKNTYVLPDHRRSLLKARLKGRLPRGEYPLLAQVRKLLEDHLLYLVWNHADVREEITLDDIHHEFTEGSFPHTLLTDLSRSGDSEALQIAYELMQELRTKH
jgi:DNA repair exonuclease SbcCD nuclease subunit